MASDVGLLTLGDPRALHVRRIVVDGVDVTARGCLAADDRRGWALVLRRNEYGGHYFDWRGHLAAELLTGDVEVAL